MTAIEQWEEMLAPTELMPAVVRLPKPEPEPEQTWQELKPYQRDELVAACASRWSPEDGPAPRYSQEYRLALALVRRVCTDVAYARVFDQVLYKRVCARLGYPTTGALLHQLSLVEILIGLEPADVAWAYLETYGQAPVYGETVPEDTFLL